MAGLTCVAVSQYCAAPANLIESSKPTRLPTCTVCGEHVCHECSMSTTKGRICDLCIVHEPRGVERLVRVMHRRSGYKITLTRARQIAVEWGWTEAAA